LTVLILVAAFLCGSIPFSWFLGKAMGVDLLKEGSGNPGATNLLRCRGVAAGLAGFLPDAAKGAVPVLWAVHRPEPWVPAAAALAAILGHVFMPWFGFRGGKGVATALGALLVLSPPAVLCSLGVFIVTVALSRMVSLGSILGAAFLALFGVIFRCGFWVNTAFVVVAVVVILGHRGNMGRTLAGTERRLGAR